MKKSKIMLIKKKSADASSFFVECRTLDKFTTKHHWHDCIELEVLISGTGTHYINNKAIPISRGSSWLVSYSASHRVEFDSPVVIFNVMLNENLLEESLKNKVMDFPFLFADFSEDDLKLVENILYRLAAIDQSHTFYREFGSSAISLLVLELLRKSNIASVEFPRHVQTAVSYIHKNFKRQITLKNTADELGLSPNYLGKLFSETLSVNFNEYLNSTRLHAACSLLKDTDISVKEVATEVGYQSVEYFLYAFKKTMNLTPSQYRLSISRS